MSLNAADLRCKVIDLCGIGIGYITCMYICRIVVFFLLILVAIALLHAEFLPSFC